MRRSLVGGILAALAGALLITACSDDSRAPTEPAPPPVSASIVPSGCPSVGATANMIVALFPAKGGERLVATIAYAAVLIYINTRHQADARTLVFRLLDFTLQQFNAGKLVGETSLATRTQLLAFETGLYCTVGLPTTGLTLPGDPHDPGTVNQVVFPSGNTQNVVTPDANHDKTVDWEEGEVAFRSIMVEPKGGDQVKDRVITHIPFNFASQATHPDRESVE